jgi:hypothetical protein
MGATPSANLPSPGGTMTGQNVAKQRYYRFPDEEASPAEIIAYRDRHFAEYFTYRDRHMQRIVKDIYYDIGRQWIELHGETLIEGARGYAFREMQNNIDIEIPRPVTNVVSPAIDVEFATLAKRQWVPKIPTFSRNPRIEASAKVAHEILTDRLKKLYWDTQRDTFIRNMITMGTAIFYSFWDASHYDLTWAAVSEPMECSRCGTLFANENVPVGLLALRQEMPNATVDMLRESDYPADESVKISTCPGCNTPDPLRKVDLTQETSRGRDPFGRPLGGMVPKGNTNLEILTPFEYYPQNAGIFMTPETTRMHGICKVRSLDWVEEHWPDIIDKVEPEDPVDLLREHPLLGEWDIVGRFDHALDAGIFDHHVRVYELIGEPTHRFPNGRLIRIIGKRQALIAENRQLVVDLEDTTGKKVAHVPLAMIAGARWKIRQGEYWGKALPDDIISPQNRINGIDSQTIDARERMGSPNLMIPEDADLQGPEYRSGYGTAKIFRYRLSALNPQAKPEVFGSILMPQGVNTERNAMMEDITKIIGPADIEIGEAPRNVTTTSGLQILGEQAERRRGTRERGVTTAFQRVWEHQLQMLWVLREEPDEYASESPDGIWEVKQFTRDNIAGHTRVEVERQAFIDRSIAIREATREAITDQLVDISDPLVRKKAIELMGLPNELNEKSNIQIDRAKRIWADFVDTGAVPVVDATLDDPFLNSQVLGTFLKQDEGIIIAQRAGWPMLAPLLAGWQQELEMVNEVDAKVRAQYGGEPPPQKAQEIYAQLKISYTQAKEKYDLAIGGALGPLAQQQAMNQPAPEAPLPPQFVPRQIEERIYLVWQKMLQAKINWNTFFGMIAARQLMKPEVAAANVDKFLRFRAVVEAYAKMAGPAAPAPGGMEPAAGPEPGPVPGGQEGGPPVGSEPLPPPPPPTPPTPV